MPKTSSEFAVVKEADPGSVGGDSTWDDGDAAPIVLSERITVALIAKAAADLRALQAHTGLSKTDITNRSIQLYRFISDQLDAGNDLLVRSANGEVERIRFL